MASLVLKKGVFIVLCVFMQKERKAPFTLLYLKQHEQERKNMQHSSKVNKHAAQTASKWISKMRQTRLLTIFWKCLVSFTLPPNHGMSWKTFWNLKFIYFHERKSWTAFGLQKVSALEWKADCQTLIPSLCIKDILQIWSSYSMLWAGRLHIYIRTQSVNLKDSSI